MNIRWNFQYLLVKYPLDPSMTGNSKTKLWSPLHNIKAIFKSYSRENNLRKIPLKFLSEFIPVMLHPPTWLPSKAEKKQKHMKFNHLSINFYLLRIKQLFISLIISGMIMKIFSLNPKPHTISELSMLKAKRPSRSDTVKKIPNWLIVLTFKTITISSILIKYPKSKVFRKSDSIVSTRSKSTKITSVRSTK